MALLLLLVLTGGGFPASAVVQDAREDALDAIVRIDADGRVGAGIVLRRVGRGLVIVTAAHVVDGANSVRARLRAFPGLWMEVQVIESLVDRESDVAVARVELAPEARAVSSSGSSVSAGLAGLPVASIEDSSTPGTLRLVGQPSFEGWFVSKGVEVQRSGPDLLRLHYHCANGMSGGGVFDARWRLVGMTLRRYTAQICEAVPAKKLVETLGRWGIPTSWRPAVDRSANAEPTTIGARPLVTSAATVPGSPKLSAGLAAATLTQALSDAISEASAPTPGLPIRFVPEAVVMPQLDLEILSYDARQVSTATYGIQVRSDIFEATFRATLRSAAGRELWTTVYRRVEVVDHQGENGWALRGDPPLAELLAQLAPRLVSDLIASEVLSFKRSGEQK